MSINICTIYLIYFIGAFFVWFFCYFQILLKSNQYKINKNIFIRFNAEYFGGMGVFILIVSIAPICLINYYFYNS
jgi:hypothetical protein